MTKPSVESRGAPLAASGTKAGAAIVPTRLTSLRCAISVVNDVVAPPETGLKTDTVMSDGLVLARNVGYEDWVRRPASIEAMATPPVRPMSTATPR